MVPPARRRGPGQVGCHAEKVSSKRHATSEAFAGTCNQRAMLRELRQWRSIFQVRFVETSVFTRRITDALSDDEYRLLQEALLRRPAQGDLIEGAGGVRKLRWKEQGRGKRGGLLANVVAQEFK